MLRKQYGIVPEKKFLERSTMPIFFNRHSCFGIIPLKWLSLNISIHKLESLSISSGILSKKLLSLMSSVKREDELRIAFGNDPMSLFPLKSTCPTCCRFQQEGNNPVRNYEKGLLYLLYLFHTENDFQKSCYSGRENPIVYHLLPIQGSYLTCNCY